MCLRKKLSVKNHPSVNNPYRDINILATLYYRVFKILSFKTLSSFNAGFYWLLLLAAFIGCFYWLPDFVKLMALWISLLFFKGHSQQQPNYFFPVTPKVFYMGKFLCSNSLF
jgi:hypothetical protein